MKYGLIVVIIAIFFLSASSVFAVTFYRDLTIGSTGQDVYELQKVLNTNPETQLAVTGPGSPGNETTYFGSITHNAVVRYQNLFKESILTPVGLFFGTGYVGPSTRKQLNSSDSIKENSTTSTAEVSQMSNSNASLVSGFGESLAHSKELYLFYPSLYTGNIGTTLTLHGAGFESDNSVYFDNTEVHNVSSGGNGTTITLRVPNIDTGYYKLRVKNSKGITDTDAFFIVTNDTSVEPTITNVSPEKGYYGEKVVVTGTGFAKEDNQVRTSYGIIDGLTSTDGRTLEFAIRPYPDTAGIQEGVDLGRDISWDISLNVINDGGISNRKIFTLEF